MLTLLITNVMYAMQNAKHVMELTMIIVNHAKMELSLKELNVLLNAKMEIMVIFFQKHAKLALALVLHAMVLMKEIV